MIEVYVASAFSKDGAGGNKAGGVIGRPELTDVQKRHIAAELGYSETAYVTDSDKADFKLEYFTPTEEVPLCGHATIATFFVLKHLGMLQKTDYTIETKSGILKIRAGEDGTIYMEQNLPMYLDTLEAQAFGGFLGRRYIPADLTAQVVSTGLKDVILPIDSPEHLRELEPDFPAMADFSREKDVIGIHAFTLVDDPEITALCRNFAPLYGIDEESATGTANCALASFLFRYHEKKERYVFEQGHNLNAVSRIVVNIKYHDDVIDSVFVGGHGYIVSKKELDLS